MAFARPAPVIRNEAEDALASLVRFFLFVSLGFAAVLPHTFQALEAGLFVVTTLLCLTLIRRDAYLDKVMVTYFAGVVLTAIYVWVGYVNGAPKPASNQILFVYVVSPLMWIAMSTALFQYVGLERATQWLILLTGVAVVSVALFFYAFLSFGASAVSFLSSDVNVNVADGYAGANFLVYGSMIFLTGGLFAQPTLVRNRWLRFVLPIAVLLAAITSGRSALILSVPMGVFVGALLRSRLGIADRTSRSILLPTILLGIAAVIVLVVLTTVFSTVDVNVIYKRFMEKLTSGGGSERSEQTVALWNGFLDSYGIGVGHGVGVPYIRNMLFPWRYEVMPLATLLRVGVIGTLVYMSTFFLYGGALIARLSRREMAPEDIYMAGGFASVALAVWTNPYIESFVFQWMYFLPVMSIGIAMRRRGA